MSQLLRTIMGPVIPDIPKQENIPVPYRPPVIQPLAPVVEGSQPVEPVEPAPPIIPV